jgi:hypothetical protein
MGKPVGSSSNNLTFEQRYKLIQWLQANEGRLPSLTIKQIMDEAGKHINGSCSDKQLRKLCTLTHTTWSFKREKPPSSARSDTRTGRLNRLEERFGSLCKKLGIPLEDLDSDSGLNAVLDELSR